MFVKLKGIKMLPKTLDYIEKCASHSDNASVKKLSCADVRSLLIEREELIAEINELLKNASYADGLATVLTRDCEALGDIVNRVSGRQ